MVKKQTVKNIELPLVDALNNKLKINLFDKEEGFITPQYLKDNLKHTLRPYQEKALFNLDWSQRQQTANYQYNQLLFNMATGSGKTDVLAATILYMFAEYNYQNFLFVVNTESVVAKTEDNLLNSGSSKYLFNDPININGQLIEIKRVTKFPINPEDGVIYIRLSTIQKIANEVEEPKENGITYTDFSNNKVVILADEAHHFSASTKTKKSKKEKLYTSWENILDRIRQENHQNRQFEFTATIDLLNEQVYNKYKDRVIYRYRLSNFINDKYSKTVFKIQANNNDRIKMLNVVLLSQFRKRIAKENNIPDFKPVILFKSNKIAASNNAKKQFIDVINKLNVSTFIKFIKSQLATTRSEALKLAYNYWLTQDPAESIIELKNDFSELNIINVNDSSSTDILKSANNFHNLNNLEDVNNPFRVIFAVAKLTEGWDVLNLYDIVRIGEQPITINQTNSEAQLIGRGARYNPFVYKGKKSYKRRFDNSSEKLQLLEKLYYHTINDAKYLDNLQKSLEKIDLPVKDDSDFNVFEAKVKSSFKKSKTYKYGKIYYNELKDVPDEEYGDLGAYGINVDSMSEVNMVNSTWESAYNRNKSKNENALIEKRFLFYLKDAKKIVKKAMSKNKFYRFNSLIRYIPTLKSLNEFITSNNWLGGIKLFVRVANGAPELDISEKLLAVQKYLSYVQLRIVNNYKKKQGSNNFIPVPIKEVVKDYSKKVNKQVNNTVGQLIAKHDMKKYPWFVFDSAIVDQLEDSLIEVMASFIDKLKEKYENVYLIRNDEQNSKFKLHEFNNKIRNYNGFMPDFILYIQDKDYYYQIYVEPKGYQLLEKDAWKEQLLESIRPENIKVIDDNSKIRLYGVKFFKYGDPNHIEKEIMDKLNN